MSEPLRGVVVCHGVLADALIGAAAQITGVTDALVAVSNTDCDRGRLGDRIVAAVDGQPSVVFVDMASGSCMFAVLQRLRDRPSIKVVTGVNLAMLLDFVFHLELSPEAAAASAAAAGGQAIRVA